MFSLVPNRGFTLLEVVISMAILAFGLLGVASLHMVSLQNTNAAYLRSQAVTISDDLIERIRNNPALLAHAIENPIDSSDNFSGETETTPSPNGACSQTDGCSPEVLINSELHEWSQSLKRLGDMAKKEESSTPPVHVTLTYQADNKLFELIVNWQSKQWDSTSGKRKNADSSYKFVVAID